jgi:hypothetical protein
MNREAAYRLLSDELAAYRQLGHHILSTLVGNCDSHRRRGSDSMEYAIDVSVRWHGEANGDLLVTGCASPADWGSPHDQLTESLVVHKNAMAN